MVESGFRLLLINAPAVAAIVADRIYHNTREENERRASIVLTMVSSETPHVFNGPAGYMTGTMQIDCLAPTYTQAKQLAQAVRQALDGYTGVTDGTTLGYIMVDEAHDIPAAPLTGQARPTFGVSVDADFLATDGF